MLSIIVFESIDWNRRCPVILLLVGLVLQVRRLSESTLYLLQELSALKVLDTRCECELFLIRPSFERLSLTAGDLGKAVGELVTVMTDEEPSPDERPK